MQARKACESLHKERDVWLIPSFLVEFFCYQQEHVYGFRDLLDIDFILDFDMRG